MNTLTIVQWRTLLGRGHQPGSWGCAGHVTDANAGIEAKDRGAPLEIRDAAGVLKSDAGQRVPKSVFYLSNSSTPMHYLF